MATFFSVRKGAKLLETFRSASNAELARSFDRCSVHRGRGERDGSHGETWK